MWVESRKHPANSALQQGFIVDVLDIIGFYLVEDLGKGADLLQRKSHCLLAFGGSGIALACDCVCAKHQPKKWNNKFTYVLFHNRNRSPAFHPHPPTL
jgi:hypothetical protein